MRIMLLVCEQSLRTLLGPRLAQFVMGHNARFRCVVDWCCLCMTRLGSLHVHRWRLNSTPRALSKRIPSGFNAQLVVTILTLASTGLYTLRPRRPHSCVIT